MVICVSDFFSLIYGSDWLIIWTYTNTIFAVRAVFGIQIFNFFITVTDLEYIFTVLTIRILHATIFTVTLQKPSCIKAVESCF